ncbi:MAG: Unknown protein [uncultured Campylobacterales bacterium]|uniref:Uncharacterized protein n=1 Tax=uncultured Campylobacterales bacterium TaxID=352960 RepID=A0A6S6T983_9BACT|nr:MAG: Unknown protein [uncultured Campylobacterales bacterium]
MKYNIEEKRTNDIEGSNPSGNKLIQIKGVFMKKTNLFFATLFLLVMVNHHPKNHF